MKTKFTYITTLFIVFLSLFYTKIHAQTITMGTITGSPFCRGASFSVPYTATGTFNTTPINTFFIEMSDPSGNFPGGISPFPFVGSIITTTSNTVSCTMPASAPVSNLYVFRAVSDSPTVTSSNVTNPITVQSPVYSSANFGTNSWNAYAFSDNNFTNYAGSFPISSLDFNTQTFYNANASPSSAAGYSGCPVPVDNHSVIFKRRGFPCDFYQIDIPAFDDRIEIFINGSPTPIYTNNSPSTNISNVARVFLGANSTVEVRLREFTVGGFVALRFTPVPAILTSSIVYKCGTTPVTLTATSDQAGVIYRWTEAGTLISPVSTVTVNPTINTTYVVTVTDPANSTGPGICSKSMNVDVIVTGLAVTTVNPTNTTICGNTTLGVPLTASGANTYTWTPGTGLNTTTGSTVIANPTTTQTYTVTGNNCGVLTTATVTVAVGNNGGNPATFGAGQWNVYAYNGSNFNTYAGYYIEPATVVSFDSALRWVNGVLGSPSSASGYVGCNVGVNNHSVIYKRKGFVCGRYQLNIPTHDDDVSVFVNGAPVFQHINGCCDAHANIWTGYLDGTSTIEYRWQEGTQGSQGALNIVSLPTTPLFNTPVVNVCPAINQTVTANVLAGATYAWTAAPGLVSSSANVATVNGLNGTSQDYTVTATLNGCSYSSSVTVNFTATNPIVTITAPITGICGGTPVTLTANGATTYEWSPGAGLSATTGAVVTANPTATQTYTVKGFNDCLLFSTATVIVTVPPSPSTFGAGVWNAYVYSGAGYGNNPTTTTPPLSTYQGFYTENTLNFFSANIWVGGGGGTPSSVSNYVGCPVGVDNHSVVYKREGFPCGYYSLDIRHDDQLILIINGTPITGIINQNTWDLGNPAIGAWTGFLGASSTIELRWIEGAGGSYGGITFNAVNPQTLLFSGINPAGVTICEGLTLTSSLSTLTANTVAGVVYTWAVTSGAITLGTPSLPSGTSIDVYAPPGSTGTGSVTCTATVAGCSVTKVINFTINPNPNTAVMANKTSMCLGETVKLDASGANAYAWTVTSPNAATAGLSATTGFTINSTPTLAGTYTYSVAGNNNCNTISQTVTVTVLGPTIAEGTAGDGVWNVFCYAGNADGLVGSVYKGHYTEAATVFSSLNRWGVLSSPFPPAGVPISTYVGCEVPVNNHTIRYIRKGFTCGNYQIDVPAHDDTYQLFINNNLVNKHEVCCDNHPNAWTGLLRTTDVVEFRWYEGIGESYGALNIGFAPSIGLTTTWSGTINNNWFNPANWCPGLPNATTSVTIPANFPVGLVPNMPVIDPTAALGQTAEANNITINGTLTIASSSGVPYPLNIYGNWTNNGTFTPNNSTVNFVGTPANIGGTNPTTFFNLNQTTNITLGAPVAVNNTLSLNNAQLSLGGNTLTINNSNPLIAGITRGTGFILSETNSSTNNNIVCWNAGAKTANFEFPFGVDNSATGYIPVFFNKKTATNYSVCVSTRGTPSTNLPIATGANLLNIYGFLNGENVVDRWWDINTSINPLPLADAADIELTYRGLENTTPTPSNIGILAIQHFDPVAGIWETPYASSKVGVTTGTSTIIATNVRKFSPHVIVPIFTPLPIELLYFSARKNNAQVDINWETITEKDNNFFNVERSSDNVRFESIGMVLAKKTIGNKTYNLVDKNPLSGTSYYRLKQTDNDGKISYSKSVSVNFGEKNTATLDIFPNPTTQDNIGMLLLGEKEESYLLSISNMEGKVIFSQNIKTDTSGKYKATLPMQTNLAQGVYVMKAVSENNVFVKKIIIQ